MTAASQSLLVYVGEVEEGPEWAELNGDRFDPCLPSLTELTWQDRSCRHDRKDKIRCHSASTMGPASTADSCGCLMRETAVDQFDRAQ